MSYTKASYTATEYAGESFTKEVKKQSGETWATNETGSYEMYDTAGTMVASGDAVKSGDELSLTFTVPATDTTSFIGSYLLLFYLKDTGDTNIKDVILEYTITYKEKKGPN